MKHKEMLESAFNILCQISVKDADVDRMVTVKQILRSIYAELPEETKGENDNGR